MIASLKIAQNQHYSEYLMDMEASMSVNFSLKLYHKYLLLNQIIKDTHSKMKKRGKTLF